MNAQARPFIAIAVYMCAILAFIFSFVYFMRMQEEASENNRFRTHGAVSRAVVTEKKLDTITRPDRTSFRASRSRSRTTSSPINVMFIRFEPRSVISISDYGTKALEEDLPSAPPVTGRVMTDMDCSGLMWVSDEVFAVTQVGDMLVVVNTPFDRSSPKLVSEVMSFDQSTFYPWILGYLLLSLCLAGLGLHISKGGRGGGA
jgi:hypothetical protein